MQFKLHFNNTLVKILKQNQKRSTMVENFIKLSREDIIHEDIGRKVTFYSPSQTNFTMEH